jgi:hypothetical protein
MPAAAVLTPIAAHDCPSRLCISAFRTVAGMARCFQRQLDVLAFPKALFSGLRTHGPCAARSTRASCASRILR